jgi:hypothetical protein
VVTLLNTIRQEIVAANELTIKSGTDMEHEQGKEKVRCRAIAGADTTEIGSNVLSPLRSAALRRSAPSFLCRVRSS